MLLLWTFFGLLLVARGEELSNEISEKEQPRVTEESLSNATVLETYQQAVQSYLNEDWDACIQGFRDLIYKFKKYKSTLIRCRSTCRNEAEESTPIFRENIEDLQFYEKKIKETLCILNCNQEYREVAGKNALKRIPIKQEWKLLMAEHYGYLHSCYFQKKYYQRAADAVFTYLIYHPDHKPSQSSLSYYMSLPEVNNKTVKNLEAEPFVEDYVEGVEAYEDGYYEEAIAKLESSLKSYIEAEEQCRFYCEGPFEQGWNPDFTTAVSNHFVFNLNCKRRCSRILSTLNGEYRTGFLANHFNYLQFAYSKLGNIKKACEAVQSYLSFYPADETMLNNKIYYESLPVVKEEYFVPRKVIVNYVKRQEYEMRILLYINEEFLPLEKKLIENDSKLNVHLKDIQAEYHRISNNSLLENMTRIVSKNRTRLIANSKKLGGQSRILIDGLINSSECQLIMELAKMTAWEGDGYDDNKSPHSEFERFEGVTIGRLAVLTYFGLLEPSLLKLLLKVTEAVRKETEKIFQMNKYLYISYTHLVCRSALPGSPENRSDYSHQIHADNCILEDNGNCRSESPAYTWRDYSTILYLNDGFEGGNFIFVKDKSGTVIESTVVPKCGRMLSFSAGGNNLHGVTAVTKGQRCALGIWFTFQRNHEDIDRELADAVLAYIEKENTVELADDLNNVRNYEIHKRMLIDRFLIGKHKIT